ncbi:MAG: MarR family winged helix-turn-helix transcriptional regulator [Aristaeellaceae bacterium]
MCRLPRKMGPLIKRINDCIAKEANSHLKAHNLTLAQNRLLMTLYRQAQHTATLKELEGMFHVSQPTMAGLAERLEAKGFVNRCPDPADKRVKHVRLTDEGYAICLASLQDIHSLEDRMLAVLSPEEQEQLLNLLERIASSLS